MNDNFIPTVHISLSVYENMEKRLRLMEAELDVQRPAIEENIFLHTRIKELEDTVSRLSRIVDGLQVQHRNDQGLD